jgi:hypothetical protein
VRSDVCRIGSPLEKAQKGRGRLTPVKACKGSPVAMLLAYLFTATWEVPFAPHCHITVNEILRSFIREFGVIMVSCITDVSKMSASASPDPLVLPPAYGDSSFENFSMEFAPSFHTKSHKFSKSTSGDL